MIIQYPFQQLARIHANVTAIDPGEDVIKVAREHLLNYGSNPFVQRISYKNESIEDHIKTNADKYDAVIVSEVLEHVNDKHTFLTTCTQALKACRIKFILIQCEVKLIKSFIQQPGGSIFITTFNKTSLSWIGGIIIAENILRLVPEETHDWEKFIPPIDLRRILNDCKSLNSFVSHKSMPKLISPILNAQVAARPCS